MINLTLNLEDNMWALIAYSQKIRLKYMYILCTFKLVLAWLALQMYMSCSKLVYNVQLGTD